VVSEASIPLRDRLLSEAIGILSREGGAGLTVRRVAAAAGCSTIGVYTHFDGKPGLLDAVVKDGFEALDGAVAVVDSLDGGIARLRAGAHAYRDWALKNPTRYRVMFDAYVPDLAIGPEAAARGGASFAAHRARVAYAVARGELLGPIDASPDHASPDHAIPDHASPDHASPHHAGPDHAGQADPGLLDHVAHHIWACLHGHVLLQLLRGIGPDDEATRAEFDRAVRWLLQGLSGGADEETAW
jgi:AcrR family transcriptional regulator